MTSTAVNAAPDVTSMWILPSFEDVDCEGSVLGLTGVAGDESEGDERELVDPDEEPMGVSEWW